MARTALTAVQLAADTGTLQGAGATPDASNGNTVASPGPFAAVIIVTNADSGSHSLILRAAGFTGAATDAANTGVPTPVPFSQAATGDLTVAVAASTTRVIPIQDTDRFTQSDGSMWLDWTASTSVTVYVLTLPYTVV